MPVDISSVLHVLAHELRTPTGIAQGYVRLFLENRLVDPADQRRALEQTQKALGRITELAEQSTAFASLFDGEGRRSQTTIAVSDLLARVAASAVVEPPLIVDASVIQVSGCVRTFDTDELASALVTVIKVAARELRAQPCALASSAAQAGTLDLFVGSPERFAALAAGPHGAGAGPLAIDRGGVGLSLLHADAVLDAHGVERWTVDASRQAVGMRFRLEEGTTL